MNLFSFVVLIRIGRKSRMYLRYILFVFIFWVGSEKLKGQDPVYSQFYNAPLVLNPAFAGIHDGSSISMIYRLQWPGLSAAYNTFSLGYDQYLDKSKLGLGLNITSDSAGDGALASTKVSGLIGYKLPITRDVFIRGGIELGFVQKRLNWQKLEFYDAIESNGGITPGGGAFPSLEREPTNTSRQMLDIGSGLLLNGTKFYIGISADHLNTPIDNFLSNQEQNYIGLPIRWSFHGGYQFTIVKASKKSYGSYFSPNILYTRQADFSQLNVGSYFAFDQLFLGLWYRQAGGNGDAAILTAGWKVDNIKLAYSFDITLSGINISEGGAHELGMSYAFYKKPKSKINECLDIFR